MDLEKLNGTYLNFRYDPTESLRIAFNTVKNSEKEVLCVDLMSELKNFFDSFNKSKIAQFFVKEIYIDGFGRNFACGANIKEIQVLLNGDMLKSFAFSCFGQDTLNAIRNCPKPVTASVKGYALGGGLELAMACHKMTTLSGAVMGFPEVTLGIIPGWGGTQWWKFRKNTINREKFFHYMKTGEMFSAEMGFKMGIIDEILKDNSRIKIPEPKKYSRKAMLVVEKLLSSDSLKFVSEAMEFSQIMNTNDATEGITAFLQKREANFQQPEPE